MSIHDKELGFVNTREMFHQALKEVCRPVSVDMTFLFQVSDVRLGMMPCPSRQQVTKKCHCLLVFE